MIGDDLGGTMSLEQLTKYVRQVDRDVYGFWQTDGKRAPGLIERNDEMYKILVSLKHYGKNWIIPLLILLAVIGLLNVVGAHGAADAVVQIVKSAHGGG